MKVHISIDMEGICGVADGADVTVGAPYYAYCQKLMTAECNAAIAGCFDAGSSEVIVNDSHGTMMNLLQEELDPRVKVARGGTKSISMAYGIDRTVAATLFIGYHARVGGSDGVLNHTMSSRTLTDLYINTEPAGELRLNAAMAGEMGVPVALVTGDDVVCAEARELLGDVETVSVKEAVDKYTALSIHPSLAREQIHDGAVRALTRIQSLSPYKIEMPATMRVVWNSSSIAVRCEDVPGTLRVAPCEVTYSANNMATLYRVLRVFLSLAGLNRMRPYTYD